MNGSRTTAGRSCSTGHGRS